MTVPASRAQLRASFLRWALFFVPVVVLLGFLSGMVSGSTAENPWFANLVKPALYPPPATFGIAWTILYILMGFAAALVASAWGAKERGIALALFGLQLALNLVWSPVFFALHNIQWALYIVIVLDLVVWAMVYMFWRVRRLAGLLLLPYVAWLAFATLLTWQILDLNPQASGTEYSGAVQRIEL